MSSFENAINRIFADYGVDTLLQKGRFLSLMMDLAPECRKEVKMVSKSCSQELLSRIAGWAVPTVVIEPEKARMYSVLLEEEGLSEVWAEKICSAFYSALRSIRGETGKTVLSNDYLDHSTNSTSIPSTTVILVQTPNGASQIGHSEKMMASTASTTLNSQVGVSTDKDSLTSRLEAAYQAAKRASAVLRTTPKEDFVINGDCLIRYKGHSSEVVIPDGIATIEKWAFMNNTTLSSITLPNSLREIKDTAFY